ncbi:succinate--CoA ligase subunit alpha [Desulfocurvus sp. DL9XJH121]
MLLNEHKSKLLLAEAGIQVPEGILLTPQTLEHAAPPFKPPWYLKAQILAPGRGRAGGVARVDRKKDLAPLAKKLFALVVDDKPVPLLRLERGVELARECSCSFSVSRDLGRLVFTVGRQGGAPVEGQSIDNLLVQHVPMSLGLRDYHMRAAFFHLGVDNEHWGGFRECVKRLYEAVCNYGLLMVEIDSLVLTADLSWAALNARVEIDDNFLMQHGDLERFYAPEHASRAENLAREAGLAYHSLPGRFGLVVNGAGLAMATMDLLNLSGLPAANFMDLGGAANLDRMRQAMHLLFADKGVTAVFVNIFGGVLSCSKLAMALSEALDEEPPVKPLVVRLSGNDADEGRAILGELDIPELTIVSDMASAVAALRELDGQGGAAANGNGRVHADVPFDPAPFPASMPFEKGMPVLVQGITGRTAQWHTALMRAHGTRIVAGVTPFKGGRHVENVPVYDSVRAALAQHEIGASIIFVPAAFAPEAILEAAFAGIKWIVCITDGITQHDMLRVKELLPPDCRLVGPNNPGIIAPGRTKIGIMPDQAFSPGPVAVLARSSTLTYEAAMRLTAAGIGQSLAVGLGGDPFVGTSYIDMCELLRHDPNTRAVLVLGEIGGRAEEELAEYVTRTNFPKPVAAFIAGRTAPPGKRLGHAGAIIDPGHGVDEKIKALEQAGIAICPDLSSLPATVKAALDKA